MLRIEGSSKSTSNRYRIFNAGGQMMQEGRFVDGEAIRLDAKMQSGIYYITVDEKVQKFSVIR
jgi:hypothetical protein